MPKVTKVLSDVAVKNLGKGLHSVGGVQGLKLQVTPPTARSWILRAKINGKTRDIGLGSYPTISLKAAREIAQSYWEQIKAGRDPLQERQKSRDEAAAARASRKTFKECASDCIAQQLENKVSNKSVQQWTNTIKTYVLPVMGDLPVSDINKAHIIQVLEPIWDTKHETASRLRGRLERILDYAKARGYRSGDNPANYKGNLEHVLANTKNKVQEHHPSLPYVQVQDFISSLNNVGGIASKALLFGILTGTRSGEVRGAQWSEIDLKQKTWTIPADRMKAGKEHVVPLSNQAITVLKALADDNESLVFPSMRGKKLSDAAVAKVIKDMHQREITAGKQGWTDPDLDNRVATPHGFRSTFRVWAADNVNLPSEIIEHALAHKLKDRVEAAYQRKSALPKRVRLMQQWADYCFKNRGSNVANIA
ncbi:tyrosine-type recombinase/integrase [Litorivicinus sp.]|nr:tyrosine-type recombinase/integrase [Litorivicinus sp.]